MAAELDIENDQLTVDNRNKNQQLKRFSAKLTKLEVDLVEAQTRVGDFGLGDGQLSEPDKRDNLPGVSPMQKKKVGALKAFFSSKPPWSKSKKAAKEHT